MYVHGVCVCVCVCVQDQVDTLTFQSQSLREKAQRFEEALRRSTDEQIVVRSCGALLWPHSPGGQLGSRMYRCSPFHITTIFVLGLEPRWLLWVT